MKTIRISELNNKLKKQIAYIKSKGTYYKIGGLFYTKYYELMYTDEGFVLENHKDKTKTIFTNV